MIQEAGWVGSQDWNLGTTRVRGLTDSLYATIVPAVQACPHLSCMRGIHFKHPIDLHDVLCSSGVLSLLCVLPQIFQGALHDKCISGDAFMTMRWCEEEVGSSRGSGWVGWVTSSGTKYLVLSPLSKFHHKLCSLFCVFYGFSMVASSRLELDLHLNAPISLPTWREIVHIWEAGLGGWMHVRTKISPN